MVPAACGQNYAPKGMPSDAMPYAPGCVDGAFVR